MKAVLFLEDRTAFFGEVENKTELIGEVIFNTAIVGYQELLTDPANAGKILVLTYPLIGNYGCSPKFNESNNAWVSALVIKEKSRIFSNWQAKESLDDFMKRHKVVMLTNVDTRSLTVHLRQKGQMLGIISTEGFEEKELLKKIEEFKNKPKETLLPKISVNKVLTLGRSKGKRIAILDLGITQSLLRQLTRLGLCLIIFPYDTEAKKLLAYRPKGLIISSGPEDDMGLSKIVQSLKELIGRLPILGISTGAEVLAEALGARLYKMKLGHHGLNYPVYNPKSERAKITVQNHSYCIDTDSLIKNKNIQLTGFNLNDRSLEEFESKRLKLLGVQYLPTSPGFDEVNEVFKRFIRLLS